MTIVSQTISTLLASDMHERVTFQREVVVADNLGGGVRTYEDVVTLWAQVIPISAQDMVSDIGIEAVVNYRIRLRYRSDITSALRILWDEKILTISAVVDVAAKHELLEIVARTGGVI